MVSVISAQLTATIRKIAQDSAEQIMISSYRSIITQVDDINYTFSTLQANKELQTILKDADTQNTAANIEKLEDILFSTDIYSKKFNNISIYALNHPEYKEYSSEHVFSSDTISKFSYYDSLFNQSAEPHWQSNDHNYSSGSSISATKLITASYSHEPIAIIQIDIDTMQFVEKIQNLKLASSGQIFISNSYGHILNPYNNDFINSFSNSSIIHQLIKENKIATIYPKINSDDFMVTTYPLDDTGFFLIGAVPMSEFDIQAKPLIHATVLTALIMAAIILLLLHYVSSFISKPIIQLSKYMGMFTPDKPNFIEHNQNDEISVLYSSFNDMQTRIIKLTNDLQESITVQKKTELKAIQAQISPHFLYNTLNSINAMAQKHNVEDIEFMTSSLATFFTRTLNNGNIYSTIENEIVHIISYINIQNVRFSNKFNIKIDIPDKIKKYTILNLTLQPLVENCIVHAFKNKEGFCQISIEAREIDNDIFIDIKDNGLGANIVDIEQLNDYVNQPILLDDRIKNYGIYNVNQRLKLYYGENYGLSYQYNYPDGLIATIHIFKKEGDAT